MYAYFDGSFIGAVIRFTPLKVRDLLKQAFVEKKIARYSGCPKKNDTNQQCGPFIEIWFFLTFGSKKKVS